MIWYSVKAREKEHFCIGSKSNPVQRKRSIRWQVTFFAAIYPISTPGTNSLLGEQTEGLKKPARA